MGAPGISAAHTREHRRRNSLLPSAQCMPSVGLFPASVPHHCLALPAPSLPLCGRPTRLRPLCAGARLQALWRPPTQDHTPGNLGTVGRPCPCPACIRPAATASHAEGLALAAGGCQGLPKSQSQCVLPPSLPACPPPCPLQSHIGNGVSFLNHTLSAKMFSPTANAEGSQLMLDFLREFRVNGEELLLRCVAAAGSRQQQAALLAAVMSVARMVLHCSC